MSPFEFREWRKRNKPLYWRLHDVFKGDRILSYGGYIRFRTEPPESSHTRKFKTDNPVIVLRGNNLQLHHHQILPSPLGRHEIRFHESLWSNQGKAVSRDFLMMVLQNVTDILIKASDSADFNKLT